MPASGTAEVKHATLVSDFAMNCSMTTYDEQKGLLLFLSHFLGKLFAMHCSMNTDDEEMGLLRTCFSLIFQVEGLNGDVASEELLHCRVRVCSK